ncbi:MAG: FAD-dependent oxidoreductase, partial [bacterium]
MQKGQRQSPFEKILNQEKLTLSFNQDVNREYKVGRIEPSPCMAACPAGVNVKAYVSLIASGRFKEALEVVRERNPFPGICGRVCTHPCEKYCNRGEVDTPVAICWLKRFVADYELEHPPQKLKPLPQTRKERVAIIGSGPAGLTAAHDLRRKGYGVTVFEALPKPGGMLISGIPAFRLPRPIIQYEIDVIRNLGVEIKSNTKIAGEKAIDKLFEEGFKAIFIAVGAHKGKGLGVPGE